MGQTTGAGAASYQADPQAVADAMAIRNALAQGDLALANRIADEVTIPLAKAQIQALLRSGDLADARFKFDKWATEQGIDLQKVQQGTTIRQQIAAVTGVDPGEVDDRGRPTGTQAGTDANSLGGIYKGLLQKHGVPYLSYNDPRLIEAVTAHTGLSAEQATRVLWANADYYKKTGQPIPDAKFNANLASEKGGTPIPGTPIASTTGLTRPGGEGTFTTGTTREGVGGYPPGSPPPFGAGGPPTASDPSSTPPPRPTPDAQQPPAGQPGATGAAPFDPYATLRNNPNITPDVRNQIRIYDEGVRRDQLAVDTQREAERAAREAEAGVARAQTETERAALQAEADKARQHALDVRTQTETERAARVAEEDALAARTGVVGGLGNVTADAGGAGSQGPGGADDPYAKIRGNPNLTADMRQQISQHDDRVAAAGLNRSKHEETVRAALVAEGYKGQELEEQIRAAMASEQRQTADLYGYAGGPTTGAGSSFASASGTSFASAGGQGVTVGLQRPGQGQTQGQSSGFYDPYAAIRNNPTLTAAMRQQIVAYDEGVRRDQMKAAEMANAQSPEDVFQAIQRGNALRGAGFQGLPGMTVPGAATEGRRADPTVGLQRPGGFSGQPFGDAGQTPGGPRDQRYRPQADGAASLAGGPQTLGPESLGQGRTVGGPQTGRRPATVPQSAGADLTVGLQRPGSNPNAHVTPRAGSVAAQQGIKIQNPYQVGARGYQNLGASGRGVYQSAIKDATGLSGADTDELVRRGSFNTRRAGPTRFG